MSIHEKASIRYWWPKVASTSFWTPETALVEYEGEPLLSILDGEKPDGWDVLIDRLRGAADEVGGYPVFLRTGLLSDKHGWEQTCYVPSADEVPAHVGALVEAQEMAWLPAVEVFAVREFLDLDTRFHAFRGRMPVNVEFRAFADQEACRCVHPYWPEGSIRQPDVKDWQERLAEMHDLSSDDRSMMETSSAMLVADRFEGAWSVDWARHENGCWYLIDMAPAALSHHEEGCPEAERWTDPRAAP